MAMTGLQMLLGARLLRRFWRPPYRNVGVWTTRLRRVFDLVAGLNLIGLGSGECVRLSLPYDPWEEDARAARREALARQPQLGENKWSLAYWRFWWAGPQGYRACSKNEQQQRLMAFFERAKQRKPSFDRLTEYHRRLAEKNMAIAGGVLGRIRRNELPAPEVPVQELEALSTLPELDDQQDLYDEIDLSNADLWDFFEEPQAFSFIVVSRATPAFLPGVRIALDGGIKSQNVNYLAIPQTVKTELRP